MEKKAFKILIDSSMYTLVILGCFIPLEVLSNRTRMSFFDFLFTGESFLKFGFIMYFLTGLLGLILTFLLKTTKKQRIIDFILLYPLFAFVVNLSFMIALSSHLESDILTIHDTAYFIGFFLLPYWILILKNGFQELMKKKSQPIRKSN